MKYIVEWNRLASQVCDWGHGALHRSFYIELPDRIKDEISRQGKPDTLIELCILVQKINHRYWECKEEILRATKTSGNQGSFSKPSGSSNNNSLSSSNNSGKPKNDKSKGSSFSASTSGSSSNGGNNKKGNNNSFSTPDSISLKLGKDGKLLLEECQRRFKNNLCLFCGQAGHSTKECPKSTSRVSKGRVATATPAALSSTPASSEVEKWSATPLQHSLGVALNPTVLPRSYVSTCPLFLIRILFVHLFLSFPTISLMFLVSLIPVLLTVS